MDMRMTNPDGLQSKAMFDPPQCAFFQVMAYIVMACTVLWPQVTIVMHDIDGRLELWSDREADMAIAAEM